MTPFIWYSGKGKNIEIRNWWQITRVEEEDHWLGEAQGIFKGGENSLYGNVVIGTWYCISVKTHRTS